jgi:hypothetical protein
VEQSFYSDPAADASNADILAHGLERCVRALLEASGRTQVVLVASTRDAFHPYTVFPQAGYSRAQLFPNLDAALSKV